MELTDNENEILVCLIENEINSDLDYLNDIKGKEKECWKNYILELKDILIKLKPIQVVLIQN